MCLLVTIRCVFREVPARNSVQKAKAGSQKDEAGSQKDEAESQEDKAESQEIEIKSLCVKSDIQYRYAKTVVTSTVVNTADTTNEIFCYIILPESAFISEFQMEIEGKVYKAYVKEKEEAKTEYEEEEEEAKAEYQEAVSAGRTARHVEYSVQDSNIFSVSLNMEKEKEVIFKLAYEELLKRELSAYKHYINIFPGQLVPDLKVEVSILEYSSISILEVPPLRGINEPEFESSVDPLVKIEQPEPNKAAICWAPTIEEQMKLSKMGVNGQLLVRYDVDRISKPEEVLINNGYFVHFFAPCDITPMRKHAVFVLDVSGSMFGRKIEQMIEAMNTILDNMAADDFFSLVIYSCGVYVWDSLAEEYSSEMVDADSDSDSELTNTSVVPAIPDNIMKAKTFVNSLKDDKMTCTYEALKKAIEIARLGRTLNADSIEQLPEPMLIFLTDGDATDLDPDEIVQNITSQNSETNAAIFSLCFDDNADMNFLKKLSSRNYGFARKIYEASGPALQLKNFYSQVALPLLSNVKFNYQDDKVDSSSVTRTSYPTLYQGSELVVVGHLHGNDIAGELTSCSRNGCCTRSIVQPVIVSEESSFMERMWAYLTIQQLLDSVTVDPVTVDLFDFETEDLSDSVTADSDQSDTNKKKALELALKYSFVTSLTSLVVVKPDDKTTCANTQRADDPLSFLDDLDEEALNLYQNATQKIYYRNRTMGAWQHDSYKHLPFGHGTASYFSSPLIGTECILGQDQSPSEGASLLKRLKSGDDLWDPDRKFDDHDSLDDDDDESEDEQDEKDVAIISKANGLALTSIEFKSNIKYQHAKTKVVMTVRNPTSELLQGEFYIPLPNDIVISSCKMKAFFWTFHVEHMLTSEAVTKLTHHSGNGLVVSRQSGEEMKVTLQLIGNEKVTVKVVYEEMVKWTGQHYQLVLYTDVHHYLKKLVLTASIEDCVDIVDANGFFEDGLDASCVESPTPNKSTISWTADKKKLKQMKMLNSSRAFHITYNVVTNPAHEYNVSPRGYPLHRHLTETPPPTDIHWVIVITAQFKEVGLTLLNEISSCVPTIISPQLQTTVFNSEDHDSAKDFIMNLEENDDYKINDALMKALEVPSTKSEHTRKAVIVLNGEKADTDVLNEIRSANKQAKASISCLAFKETENFEHGKELAFSNYGVYRILYKNCPLSIQVSDFLQQIQEYLEKPVEEPPRFKYTEHPECGDVDDFWRNFCILSETSETKLTDLAIEASIVTPATSFLALSNRNI